MGCGAPSALHKRGAYVQERRLGRRPLHVTLKKWISDVTPREICTNPNGSGHPNAPYAAPAEESEQNAKRHRTHSNIFFQ